MIPAEWIAAHGWRPCRVLARPAAEPAPAGVCPFAWAWMQTALNEPDAGCIILATECDMMRRLAEAVIARSEIPLFSFHVPTVADNGLAERIFRSELERLGRFLTRAGGYRWQEPILTHNIAFHAKARRALLERRTETCARAFAEAIVNFQHHLTNTPRIPPHPLRPDAIPLALVGSPLMMQHMALYDAIEQAGGVIALDATETGELSLPRTAEAGEGPKDLLDILTRTYYRGTPTIHRRPNSDYYAWLGERMSERGVRGVLHVHYPWCDPWRGEAQRLKEWSPAPVISLVLSGETPPNSHISTRVEAFLESLR